MEITCDNPKCKKRFEYTGGVVHYRRSKNHYCSTACQNMKHGLAKKINGKQNQRYNLWLKAKRRANKKGIYFKLEPVDIPEIPIKCPILDIKLKINSNKKTLDSSSSLDRINNNKGYIKDNIMVISHRANRMKGDFTIKELKRLLKFLENEKI